MGQPTKTADRFGMGEKMAGRVTARLAELNRCSSEPGALTRLYLTPEHAAATRLVDRWMAEAGLTVTHDAIGNVVGHAAGLQVGPRLILGSHIDTVRNAGAYDGNLGVLVAIEAMARLYAAAEPLPFGVEVIAFGDEEGVRFPVTLSGSRAIAGRFDPATLGAVDRDGVSLRQALRTFGRDPDRIASIARPKQEIFGYVEVHIEQGPVLEAEGLPVGVVTAIAGASRFSVDIVGRAGHAGTVPMALRRDALAAAAEMILSVEQFARERPGLVATVGRVEAMPGAPNVIPGRASFSVDLRSADDAIRTKAVAGLGVAFRTIAERRRVGLSVGLPAYDAAAAVCDGRLTETLARAVAEVGFRPLRLPSGAGHDGLAMQALCPIAMLFVRCAGGISHNPAESVQPSDIGVAVDVLVAFLRRLGAERESASPKSA